MIEERERIREVLDAAIARSTADQIQLGLGGGRLLIAQLDDNRVAGLHEERWAELVVRLAYRHRRGWYVGSARGGDLDRKPIDVLHERARREALELPRDLDYVPPPMPDDFEVPDADVAGTYDARTAEAGPAILVNEIGRLTLPAARAGAACHGVVAVGVGTLSPHGDAELAALANVHRLFQYYKPTSCAFHVTLRHRGGGLGVIRADLRALPGTTIDPLVERAVSRAALPRSEVDGSAQLPIVLEPFASADLLDVLAPHFSYANVQIDHSPMAAQLDRSIFGTGVSIAVDPTHTLLQCRPFDDEGWPRRRIQLVDGGIPRRLLLTRGRSLARSQAPDGYTVFAFNRPRAVAEHLVMAGRETDLATLLSGVERGLLVSRLHALRFSPPNTFLLTGRTGEDTYLIEGGRLTACVGSQPFDRDLRELWGESLVLGEAQRAGRHVAPAMRVG